MKTLAAILACAASLSLAAKTESAELVFVDNEGVIRWSADNREVALFGANYCLPSSSDYRAAGYLGADRKKLIEQDMAHFARMGWDGLRLAIWGDWENCDREGNLIVNDHLDLLDYLVFQAKQRGISMLFTPIHRHSALWPDGKDSDAIQGFSKFYPVSELGTNPAAIAAQQNYIRQILEHVNPYTGVALKNEPAIVFIELINEPHHHSSDFDGSVAYINALARAVRDTGCEKLLFFNLSQDFRMMPAIAAAKVHGFSFGWYPTALGARRTLTENYLRWVDGYTPLLDPNLPPLPRIVYEFDSADMISGYMYPAMVRAYREVGTQFAAMFAYDMLATAPYNLGWQTHHLNLVTSPRKALSAIIAAEAMRTLPRGVRYGNYPQNRRFGPFRVSYEEDSSEMVTDETFLHANDTTAVPPNPSALRRIAGTGSSPLVRYDGTGSYFLDKLADGVWRLEVYPDSLFVQDPFAQRLNYQTVSARVVWRTWPMRLSLPDLGPVFSLTPLNAGNTHAATATQHGFDIRPGVYLLTRQGMAAPENLPERISHLGLREFVCPPAVDGPVQAVPHFQAEYPAGTSITVGVDIVDETAPTRVTLHARGGEQSREFAMSPVRGFRYEAIVPADVFPAGPIEFKLTVDTPAGRQSFPSSGFAVWSTQRVAPTAPLRLFEPKRDANRVFAMRGSGDQQGAYFEFVAAKDDEAPHVRLRAPAIGSPAQHTLSLPVKAAIVSRDKTLENATHLHVRARGRGRLSVALIEKDGTAWASSITLGAETWTTVALPLGEFRLAEATKLPLGYPGNWNNKLASADGRGGQGDRLQLSAVEHLQFRALSSREPRPSIEIAHADLAWPAE